MVEFYSVECWTYFAWLNSIVLSVELTLHGWALKCWVLNLLCMVELYSVECWTYFAWLSSIVLNVTYLAWLSSISGNAPGIVEEYTGPTSGVYSYSRWGPCVLRDLSSSVRRESLEWIADSNRTCARKTVTKVFWISPNQFPLLL